MDFSIIMPHAHPEDIDFLQLILQLNPDHRLSAYQAKTHYYFYRAPLPAPLSTLLVPFQNGSSLGRRGSGSSGVRGGGGISEKRIAEQTSAAAVTQLLDRCFDVL